MIQNALADLLLTHISEVDLVALMIDGVYFAGHLNVVPLGIDRSPARSLRGHRGRERHKDALGRIVLIALVSRSSASCGSLGRALDALAMVRDNPNTSEVSV